MFGAGALLNSGEQQRRAGLLLGLAVAGAVLMMGLRYRVGGDWSHYQYIYVYIGMLDLGDALAVPNSDPGYSFINWIGQLSGAGIWFVNSVCAALFGWGLSKLGVQQPRPWLFFLTATSYGIVVVGMGYTRQAVAIGFSAAALAAFRDRGLRTAALYFVAAALFHKTAILMLPLVALADRQKPIFTMIYGIILAVLLYYFLFAASSSRLFENYIGAQMQSQGAGVRVAMTLVPAACFLLFRKRMAFEGREKSLYWTLAIAGLATGVSLAIVPSSTVVDRLNLYLIPFQSVILSRLPLTQTDPRGDLAVRVGLITYSATVLFVWLNYAANASMWVPYRFYPTA